ncbi:hypothetical protein L6273_00615 [Candidatus Parcubacteria bacterium]|nr:hypothetical protein [Candidatus Parcubacteria bacterium]
MATVKHTLFDSFSYTGEWWLPEKPEDKVSGEVSFSEEGIKLKLVGSFYGPGGFGTMRKEDIILGFTTDGKKITLVDSFGGQSVSFPGMAAANMTSNRLFIGEWFSSEDELLFSSMSLNCPYLEEWLVVNPITTGYDLEEQAIKEFRAKYAPLEPLEGRIENIDASFRTGCAFSTKSDARMLSWEYASFFKFIPDSIQPFSWHMDVYSDFTNLLTLFIGEPVYARQVRLRKAEEPNDDIIDVFFRQGAEATRESVHPHDMLVTLPQIRDNLADVLDAWFAKKEVLEPVYNLFFAVDYSPRMYLDVKLLFYAHALESFHREVEKGYYYGEEEWPSVQDDLNSRIPNGLPEDFRARLVSQIKYANEYSLRKRLYEIYDSLGEDLKRLFTDEPEAFIESVVKTRNYLVHHSPEDKAFVLRRRPLHVAVQKLKILIIFLLLKELGIDESLITTSVSNNRYYSDLFS